MLTELLAYISGAAHWVEDLQRSLTAIPALAPENNGDGETAKACFLEDRVAQWGARTLLWAEGQEVVTRNDPAGLTLRRVEAPDSRVGSGVRPNLAVRLSGKKDRTLWVIGHMDVVPAGAESLWESPPFVLRREGDWLFGRGVEDNQQAIVSALLTLDTLIRHKAVPDLSYGVLLAADEETHSAYGLDYVLRKAPGLIRLDDLVLVPDMGDAAGRSIEIAEKSCLWIKVTVTGRQCHASRPEQGVNSLVAASAVVLALGRLYRDFPQADALYTPPHSTFVPSKKEANVENINTVPGQDVFYVDCRILPGVDSGRVLARAEELAREAALAHGADVRLEAVFCDNAAPPTSMDADVVIRLQRSLKKLRGQEGSSMGSGGQTVAAFLRSRGIPAVCWGTIAGYAHKPNEKSSIKNTLEDAAVILDMLFDDAKDTGV